MRRIHAGFVVSALSGLLLMLVAVPVAFGQTDDHLKCYQMKDPLKLKGKNPRDIPYWLNLESQQFGSEDCKIVGGFRLFCVPVTKTVNDAIEGKLVPGGDWQEVVPSSVAGPVQQDQICYKIKCEEKFPSPPNPDLDIRDQFGERTAAHPSNALKTFKPFMLCGPAEKSCGDSTAPACDGFCSAGEVCSEDTGSCVCAPPPPDCGNGIPEAGEECDDGAGNSDVTPDACRTDCTLPSCGDGVVDGGEQCEFNAHCNAFEECVSCLCELVPDVCGNGSCETGEDCATCLADCPCGGGESCCAAVCENTTSDPAHCGGCGVVCDPPNGSGVCSSSTCSLAGCDPGYSDCDPSVANGCEVDHSAVGNTCSAGFNLGSYDGDRACGFICPGNTGWDLFNTRTGRTSAWYRATVVEDSSCLADIEHQVRLTVPTGVDYDLFLYLSCGGAPTRSSTNGPGGTELLTILATDGTGGLDTFTYYIEVRYVSGASCTNWSLQVSGHNCP
jgi:hypothetical protein